MKKKEKKQKIKRERKPMANTDKFMLVFLATLIIYLAIILPIRICVVSFSWHWFVFGLAAVVIPFAFIHFQLWSQKKLSFADDQKKNANVVTVKYILYFWFLDCLYMVIFNQWILWIYILGIITLVKIFYGLAVTFLGKKQKNAILDISIVFDFLLGVGLTVYLIYLIPDEFNNLQTIVTAIIAAVYGGLLTLVGVAWTIRKQDQIRREDDKKLYRPIVVVANSWDSNFKKVLLTKFSNELISYEKRENLPIETYLNSICIQNTEFTPFYIFGVLIDNTYMLAENKIYVDRNGGFVISCEQQLLHTKTEIDSVSLIIRDLLGNYYKIPLKMNKVISNKIEQPIFRQGTIILLNKSIPQIHCIDEMVAKELNNFSLNED